MPMRVIPVYAGPRIIEMCDERLIESRYGSSDRANIQIVRKRKTREIVQVNLLPLSDDSSRRSSADSGRATYQESLDQGNARLVVLKRCDLATGALLRWSDGDAFNPFRFNPDQIPQPEGTVLCR